jgi:hypothetical protein
MRPVQIVFVEGGQQTRYGSIPIAHDIAYAQLAQGVSRLIASGGHARVVQKLHELCAASDPVSDVHECAHAGACREEEPIGALANKLRDSVL